MAMPAERKMMVSLGMVSWICRRRGWLIQLRGWNLYIFWVKISRHISLEASLEIDFKRDTSKMLSQTHAQRTAGKKPVSHQAAVVLTARLSQRGGSEENKNDARHYADVGEVALVSNHGARYNRYPEPEYFTDCAKIVPDSTQDPTTSENEDNGTRNELLNAQWQNYSFLGIVQTAGSVKGMSRNEGEHYNGSTNVVHAGGTMSTINTSNKVIETNQLVCWAIPEKNPPDTLPDSWDARKTGSKFHKNKVHAVTMGLGYNDPELIAEAQKHGAIIGRAMSRAQPGGQLDLIMSM